jgi:hypothetical protein
MAESELLAAVESAFALTGPGFASWPDPHPDREPLDEEYERLSDQAKWRIVSARAEAWLVAFEEMELAVVERDALVEWRGEPPPWIWRTDRVVPYAAGALPLVLARSRIDEVDDAGVILGVGDPALCVALVPDCGCDACDNGSQYELDLLDSHVLGIVSGVYRRLTDGSREITVSTATEWSASGWFHRPFDWGQVEAVLADPTGWDELSGNSWLPAED